ncbi:MAG: NADAR family protein [Cyanobacteria bacterium P01_H01_bin.15]
MAILFYQVGAPYGCFSNFSPHAIHCAGLPWPTVEHYYQAHKFLGSPDASLIGAIRLAPTPEIAASLGRDRQRKLRLDWTEIKKQVMYRGVLTKFLTHPALRQTLIQTGDELLIENSPRDYFWGCGQDGTGANELGKVLMTVRHQLREGGLGWKDANVAP